MDAPAHLVSSQAVWHNTTECAQHLRPCPFHARYLQRNRLQELVSGPALLELRVLDVSCNALDSLAGLGARFPSLETFTAAGNIIESGLEELQACPRLVTLDLSRNALPNLDGTLAALRALPALRCLDLRGNPCLAPGHAARKRILTELPGLTFFNGTPVTARERPPQGDTARQQGCGWVYLTSV